MQHELDCLSRYLDKKGIDLILSVECERDY